MSYTDIFLSVNVSLLTSFPCGLHLRDCTSDVVGSFMKFSCHAVMVKLEANGNGSETAADNTEKSHSFGITIEANRLSDDMTGYPRDDTSRP